ncbi:transglutaminase family protein [Thermodesulfobacteriota bacterium]
MDNKHVKPTYYCNHNHSIIQSLSAELAEDTDDTIDFIKKAFFYVRDTIRFGGDIWKVKASETLQMKFGPCFGKNTLFMAILRNQGIACTLSANPMKRTFAKPSVGTAHIFFSNPFFHCFTKVNYNGQWIDLDPTLDKDNYEIFFKPLGVNWDIDWNPNGIGPIYSESIVGESVSYDDIDKALNANLNSWYLFKHEPNFLVKPWLWLGNKMMWGKIDKTLKRSSVKKSDHAY